MYILHDDDLDEIRNGAVCKMCTIYDVDICWCIVSSHFIWDYLINTQSIETRFIFWRSTRKQLFHILVEGIENLNILIQNYFTTTPLNLHSLEYFLGHQAQKIVQMITPFKTSLFKRSTLSKGALLEVNF